MSVQALTVPLLFSCVDILPACLLWDKPSVPAQGDNHDIWPLELPPGMAVASRRECPLTAVLSEVCRVGV